MIDTEDSRSIAMPAAVITIAGPVEKVSGSAAGMAVPFNDLNIVSEKFSALREFDARDMIPCVTLHRGDAGVFKILNSTEDLRREVIIDFIILEHRDPVDGAAADRAKLFKTELRFSCALHFAKNSVFE